MRMKQLLLLPLVLALSGCLSRQLGDPLQVGMDLPVRLDSPRARVRSRRPAEQAAEVAEAFSAAVKEAATTLGLPEPTRPADLVVLAPGEGKPWVRHRIGGGVVVGPEGRVLLVLSAPLGEKDRWVVRHEATHWLLDQTLTSPALANDRLSGLPLWLDEGLATAFETGGENAGRKQEFVRLASPPWRARIGLRKTLDLRRGSPISSADYARAWAVCTYLLETDPAALRALLQARAEWCRTRPPGVPAAQHERELVAAARAEFDRLVLRGTPLDEWFARLADHLAKP